MLRSPSLNDFSREPLTVAWMCWKGSNAKLLGQSGMAVLAEGQAAIMRRAQEVSEDVVDASEARGRRTRQAA